MDGEPKSRRVSLVILRIAPGASLPQDRLRAEPILHRLPLAPPDPDGGLRQVVLLHPPPREGDEFMITCDELPGVALFGEGEDEVLALTRLTIEEALRSGPPPRR